MNIQPKGFTVLVKPKDVEEELKKKTVESRIFIPETVKDNERINVCEGTVVAIGNCAWSGLGDGEPWCAVGDRILYAQFGGKFVDERNFVIIQDKDVMAVLGDE